MMILITFKLVYKTLDVANIAIFIHLYEFQTKKSRKRLAISKELCSFAPEFHVTMRAKALQASV